MPEEQKTINERVAILETICHSLVDHIRKEEEDFLRLERKVDEIKDLFVDRMGKVEKTQALHSWGLRVIFMVLGSAGLLGIAGESLAKVFGG